MTQKTDKNTPAFDASHVDHLLSQHASKRPTTFNRHLGSILVTFVLLIGAAAATLTYYSSTVVDQIGDANEVTILPTPQQDTVKADPNASLPEETKSAIATWPATTPQSIQFKEATATTQSIDETETTIVTINTFAKQYPNVLFTITAYTSEEPQSTSLASLRQEYVQSQLAEKGLARNRITLTTQPVNNSMPANTINTVTIQRSLFDNESIPQ
jgi:hypothetical protein